jgi:hypothetical protein
MKDSDFIQDFEEMLIEAYLTVNSALMSEDFMEQVDLSLGEIPSLVGVHTSSEHHGDPSDTT